MNAARLSRRRLPLLLLTLAVAGHTALAQTTAQPKPPDDPMLRAMQDELQRERDQLLLPGMQRPYFIEYRLDDLTTYEAVANYGALTLEQENHQRAVHVVVRVGDYTADSSSARGDGVVQLAPLDTNPTALRYALWTATDDAYKIALRSYAAKQAALKQFQTPPQQNDFSPAKPVVAIGPTVSLVLDRAAWKQHIVDASGLFATDPQVRAFAADVQYSTASIRAIAINHYLVNSEGTVMRNGYSVYTNSISVGGQAADGMRLGRDNGSTAVTADKLESWPAYRQRVLDDLKSLQDLRNAPVVSAEDYHGPVLLSGDAAADVFTALLVPNVVANRPDMGTTARTQGAYSSSLHARVLPEFLNVTDQPALTSFHDQQILGAYTVDDEGVPAQPVTIVQAGKLEGFLIDREPIRDFPASNGHGRAAAAQAARSRAGVVVVQSTAPLTAAQMQQKLLDLAKEQNRDVYLVETLGGDLEPRLLYLLHPDGTRQLLRGAAFDELDTRSLRSGIIAAGDDATSYVDNLAGPVPQTTIAPSILFDDITIKRASEEQQKLPYYTPPAATTSHP
ncbi:MAG: peptidase U62 [Acidobacteriota bacterium]|nr:peptidase U62 [Acidobacteriota bacterium]